MLFKEASNDIIARDVKSHSGARGTFSRGPSGNKIIIFLNGAFWCTLYFLARAGPLKRLGARGNLPLLFSPPPFDGSDYSSKISMNENWINRCRSRRSTAAADVRTSWCQSRQSGRYRWSVIRSQGDCRCWTRNSCSKGTAKPARLPPARSTLSPLPCATYSWRSWRRSDAPPRRTCMHAPRTNMIIRPKQTVKSHKSSTIQFDILIHDTLSKSLYQRLCASYFVTFNTSVVSCNCNLPCKFLTRHIFG